MDDIRPSELYEVQNPWGEVDAVAPRGLSPRLGELAGKTIGLFAAHAKIASRPVMEVVERKLREREPSLEFSWFLFDHNLLVTDTDDKARFEEWTTGLDAAVAAVGD
jgi:hypothetical protein